MGQPEPDPPGFDRLPGHLKGLLTPMEFKVDRPSAASPTTISYGFLIDALGQFKDRRERDDRANLMTRDVRLGLYLGNAVGGSVFGTVLLVGRPGLWPSHS